MNYATLETISLYGLMKLNQKITTTTQKKKKNTLRVTIRMFLSNISTKFFT